MKHAVKQTADVATVKVNLINASIAGREWFVKADIFSQIMPHSKTIKQTGMNCRNQEKPEATLRIILGSLLCFIFTIYSARKTNLVAGAFVNEQIN